jgi:hypothetical protein
MTSLIPEPQETGPHTALLIPVKLKLSSFMICHIFVVFNDNAESNILPPFIIGSVWFQSISTTRARIV